LALLIDDDVIDDFESSQVHRPQVLRHVRSVCSLGDMVVSSDAGDQNVRLAFGIEQVPHVAGMHDVEHPVTHDHALVAWARSDDTPQLLR